MMTAARGGKDDGSPAIRVNAAVVAVFSVFMIVSALILTGVLYLLSHEDDDAGGEATPLSLSMRADAGEDALVVKVLSGRVNWTDYIVSSQGLMVQTNATNSTEGETVEFFGSTFDPFDQVKVSILEISSGRVVWEATVTATP